MLRNRATPVRFLSGIHAHTTPAETHMPSTSARSTSTPVQAFGDKRGILVMACPTRRLRRLVGHRVAGLRRVRLGLPGTPTPFPIGPRGYPVDGCPASDLCGGPLKGTLLDAYDTTEQMLTAAFRAGSLSKLTQTDAEVRRMAEQLVEA